MPQPGFPDGTIPGVPSHYSAIGFAFSSDDDWARVVRQLRDEAVPVETSRGTYHRWTSASGAELWIQTGANGEVIGAHPHFASALRTPMRIENRIARDDHTALDGSYTAWVQPSESEAESDGFYPLIFDCANFHQASATALPAMASVQLAAFAQQLWAFASVEEFDAAENGEVRFGSQSFVPASSLDDHGNVAEAFLCGHVAASETRTNEVSGRSFHWAQVETYGATYDVVIDPAVLRDVPAAGGVIKGTFWLSGYVASLESRAGAFRKLWSRLRQARG